MDRSWARAASLPAISALLSMRVSPTGVATEGSGLDTYYDSGARRIACPAWAVTLLESRSCVRTGLQRPEQSVLAEPVGIGAGRGGKIKRASAAAAASVAPLQSPQTADGN